MNMHPSELIVCLDDRNKQQTKKYFRFFVVDH